MLDHLAIDRGRHRIWVPAEGTGHAVVIDGKTQEIRTVDKFPAKEVERRGQRGRSSLFDLRTPSEMYRGSGSSAPRSSRPLARVLRRWAVAGAVAFMHLASAHAGPGDGTNPGRFDWLWSIDGSPRVEAHRGVLYSSLENTIWAFDRALDESADAIELDVRLTADGVAVVNHNDRLTFGPEECRRLISETRWEGLSVCRSWDHDLPIPTFAEALRWDGGRVVLDVDIKDESAVEPVLNEVARADAVAWVFVQASSNKERYERARLHSPKVALQFRADTPSDLDWALALNDPFLRVIELPSDMLDPIHLNRIRAAGKISKTDAWPRTILKERLEANCADLFAQGVRLVLTNDTSSCVHQHWAWRRRMLEDLLEYFLTG